MRPRLCLLLACALPACTGPAAERIEDRMVRPVHSTERIVASELAPAEVAKSVRHITEQTKVLIGDPVAPVHSTKAAVNAIPGEVARLGSMKREGSDLVSRETTRLKWPGWIGDEFARVGKLGADPMGHMTTLLGLDKRLLGEPNDLRHRTDPTDDSPEASWSERLVRRIFP
jgi:hypothetical protein